MKSSAQPRTFRFNSLGIASTLALFSACADPASNGPPSGVQNDLRRGGHSQRQPFRHWNRHTCAAATPDDPENLAFGPHEFERAHGKPLWQRESFPKPDCLKGPYTLVIATTGSPNASVKLNGEEIFDPFDFHEGGRHSSCSLPGRMRLEKTVTLEESNTLDVLFKGGWRRTYRGQLVHQASFVRYHGTGFSLAVLTDGNPSMSYGIETISGVARRILHTKPIAR